MSAELRRAATRLVPLLDLTSLNDEQDDDVAALCARANTAVGPVAAVCVWPKFVGDAKRLLTGGGIRVASVVNFPDGGADADRAVREALAALDDGADEIDMVMPFSTWLAGDIGRAGDVIAAVKQTAAGRALLKVILESGQLGSAENVAAASRDAIAAGADFLKTSTGKSKPGATLEAAEAMLGAIREAGGRIGFKASGGLRTTADAASYLALADRIMGQDWAAQSSFRIGASSLLDDLLAILGQTDASDAKNDY